VLYIVLFYLVTKMFLPLLNLNTGMNDIACRLYDIKYDILRILSANKISYKEMTFLHENITTQKICEYLAHTEDKDASPEEQDKQAQEKLSEASDALDNAIGVVEYMISY